MNRQNKSSLIYIPQIRSAASHRVVCFSYAGGSAATYMSWADKLDAHLELAVIQLPGRGIRLIEAPLQTMEEMVESIVAALKVLTDKPMVFFGHSMGARVAYEVSVALYQLGRDLPSMLIASSCLAPFVKRESSPTYLLSDQDFLNKISKLNGIPKVILEDEELMQLILPALRADFRIIETYRNTNPVRLPIVGVGLVGNQDIFSVSTLERWQCLFEHWHGVHHIEGDHFYVDKNKADVLRCVNTLIPENNDALMAD